MKIDPSIFRDYDIRAVVPDQLDEEGVRRITKAIIHNFKPTSVQVGRDMRTTSPKFHKAMTEEFVNSGVDVVDLGLVSTDMLYFASSKYGEDMAITISASHNPPEYNGMKIVKKNAEPVSGETGIYAIRDLAVSDKKLSVESEKKGKVIKRTIMDGWIKHITAFIDVSKMKSFKIAIDTGNGMAGHFMPALEEKMPWKVERLYYKLDGTFPNHTPSPIEPKNLRDVISKVKESSADIGMAFDGDGDRVFLIDEKGRILSGTIMTAIIAENLLQKKPGETILYNAVVGRVVSEIIKKHKGKPVRMRVGHTLIKEAMRKENVLFGGEHSGHYYFRDNSFADSAIIAALLVIELMSIQNKKLSELYDKYDKYPSSGEINFKVEDKDGVMNKIQDEYESRANSTDRLDGISVWFDDWWFNVRPSNTEPLLRLNIEADDNSILKKKTRELILKIESMGGKKKE